MVDSEKVEHGSVQIVDGEGILDGCITEFIGCPVGDASLDATARKPDGKRLHVMIATISLRHWSASKLSAKYDQRLVKHSTPREIFNKCRCASIDFSSGSLDVILHAPVMIPVTVIKLNKTHAAFSEPSRQ